MIKNNQIKMVAKEFKSVFLISFFVIAALLIYIAWLLNNLGMEGEIWKELRGISTIKIVATKKGASGYIVSTILLEDKGLMTFSGWSLHPDQFTTDHDKPLGLSQISDCKLRINSKNSYRGWVVLNKEVSSEIISVKDAIDNYDLIYETVRSWPAYVGQKEVGKYSICSESTE